MLKVPFESYMNKEIFFKCAFHLKLQRFKKFGPFLGHVAIDVNGKNNFLNIGKSLNCDTCI